MNKKTGKSKSKNKREVSRHHNITGLTTSMERIDRKLNVVISLLNKITGKESQISKEEKEELKEEKEELKEEEIVKKEEKKSIEELSKLEEMEKEIKEDVTPNPLTVITRHDIAKAFVGALVGVIGHFAFFYGLEIAKGLTLVRATLLYIVSFIVCIVFIYLTGFRTVSDPLIIKFLPYRAFVLYFTSLIVIVIVLALFGFLQENALGVYKTVASISLLAVIGASTADLIGRD